MLEVQQEGQDQGSRYQQTPGVRQDQTQSANDHVISDENIFINQLKQHQQINPQSPSNQLHNILQLHRRLHSQALIHEPLSNRYTIPVQVQLL